MTSRSSASIRGATAIIALLPQIAVPAPISTLARGLIFNMRPKIQAEAMAAVIVITIIAKARQPTAVALAKLRLAPVKTMVSGIERRTQSFAPYRILMPRGRKFAASAPMKIARIAALIGRRVPTRNGANGR